MSVGRVMLYPGINPKVSFKNCDVYSLLVKVFRFCVNGFARHFLPRTNRVVDSHENVLAYEMLELALSTVIPNCRAHSFGSRVFI